MRVLHCPTVVGGHPSGLAAAERRLGLNSLSVAYLGTKFGHPGDEYLFHENISRFRSEVIRWKLLFRAFTKFDVIHYNFGSSILRWQIIPPEKHHGNKLRYFLFNQYIKFCSFMEYWLLKNKIIAVTYQGDDARQKDYSLNSFKYSIAKEVDKDYYPKGSDYEKREAIKLFSSRADLIYALNPDLLYVLPSRAKFVPYAHLDMADIHPVEHPRSKTPIVLHAPSHAGAKGTRFILDAVSKLKQEGIKFEFILVEHMNYSDAKKLYETCDLVIDQLLAGWYGAFAVEAMALGKPVICYIREEDTQFIPKDMKNSMPFIQATPDTIYETLREWITLRVNEFPERGKVSRRYVEQWHDSRKVAQTIIQDYKNCL